MTSSPPQSPTLASTDPLPPTSPSIGGTHTPTLPQRFGLSGVWDVDATIISHISLHTISRLKVLSKLGIGKYKYARRYHGLMAMVVLLMGVEDPMEWTNEEDTEPRPGPDDDDRTTVHLPINEGRAREVFFLVHRMVKVNLGVRFPLWRAYSDHGEFVEHSCYSEMRDQTLPDTPWGRFIADLAPYLTALSMVSDDHRDAIDDRLRIEGGRYFHRLAILQSSLLMPGGPPQC